MRLELLHYLACPRCGKDLDLEDDQREGEHVMTGVLACEGCSTRYPVKGGVPRMNEEMAQLEQVAHAFSVEWKTHHEGAWETETLFGRTISDDWNFIKQGLGVTGDELEDAVVLEAGCGSGRPLRLMAERGRPAVAIGVDINEAVDDAFRLNRDVPNAHIVQGNIFALPFKPQSFDYVWSNGVIHHTHDPAGAAHELTKQVKPGGELFIWVYAKRFSPFKATKKVFDALGGRKLGDKALMRWSAVFAYGSLGALQVYRLARRVPALAPRDERARLTVRPRTAEELKLTWFDTIAPEYVTTHSEDEVRGWFARDGFVDLVTLEEPKVGVRGRAPVRTQALVGAGAVSAP